MWIIQLKLMMIGNGLVKVYQNDNKTTLDFGITFYFKFKNWFRRKLAILPKKRKKLFSGLSKKRELFIL